MSGTCETCRFWSEMIAQSRGNGVEAMCLASGGPDQRQYRPHWHTCAEWKLSTVGAIDSPGFDGSEYEEIAA